MDETECLFAARFVSCLYYFSLSYISIACVAMRGIFLPSMQLYFRLVACFNEWTIDLCTYSTATVSVQWRGHTHTIENVRQRRRRRMRRKSRSAAHTRDIHKFTVNISSSHSVLKAILHTDGARREMSKSIQPPPDSASPLSITLFSKLWRTLHSENEISNC